MHGHRADTIFIYIRDSYCNEKHAQKYAVCKLNDTSTRLDVVKDGRRLCFSTTILKDEGTASLDTTIHAESESSRWIFAQIGINKRKKIIMLPSRLLTGCHTSKNACVQLVSEFTQEQN
jgi:hypothetical protein